MSMFDEYFTGSFSIALENVVYNKLDGIEGEVSLRIDDVLEIKENKTNVENITAIITRSFSFEPKSLVEVSVSFEVVLELNDKYKNSDKLDLSLIRKELISEDSVIMSIIMSRISLLISQLTSSYGERPIVTPPSFMESE